MSKLGTGPIPIAFLLALAAEAPSNFAEPKEGLTNELRAGALANLLRSNDASKEMNESVQKIQYFPNFPNFRNCFGGNWRNC
jgi:hypothetical protein